MPEMHTGGRGGGPAPDAAGAAPPPRGGAAWRLIWCCERSYKAEEEALRGEIECCVADFAGGLTCFKKARTFGSRLSHLAGPYVLVTDGREIKPCMQALATMAPSMRPLFIAVLQPHPKLAARTLTWLDTLPEEGVLADVHVIDGVASLRGLLGQYVCSPSLKGAAAEANTLPPQFCRVEAAPLAAGEPCGSVMPVCVVVAPGCVGLPLQTIQGSDVRAMTMRLMEAEPEVYED